MVAAYVRNYDLFVLNQKELPENWLWNAMKTTLVPWEKKSINVWRGHSLFESFNMVLKIIKVW